MDQSFFNTASLKRLSACFLMVLLGFSGCQYPPTQGPESQGKREPATIYAEVVALDQVICYNRFGSHNPYGMVYALKDDVVSEDGGHELKPGHVRLRSNHRPRPLVLRMNAGDTLKVKFTNLLARTANERFSDSATVDLRVAEQCPEWAQYNEEYDKNWKRDHPNVPQPDFPRTSPANAPKTRTASLTVNGLTPLFEKNQDPDISRGLKAVPPGEDMEYSWKADREGEHLFYSIGAPGGGEAEGGSLTHGLFGVIVVEPEGSRWYRSAVLADQLEHAKKDDILDYDASDTDGKPVLNLLRKTGANLYTLDGCKFGRSHREYGTATLPGVHRGVP